MEGIFIGVLCLSGFLTFSTCLLHQYHFVSDAMNWTEAQSYCREKYTDLATIENTEEIKKLKDTVLASGYTSRVWIGLYSHIDWKWSDGFNQSGAEYRRWYYTEPNNWATIEHCVFQKNDGKFYDEKCDRALDFVCYNGTLEDSDFVSVRTVKTWSEAQRHCREHYTDLATVTNDAENIKIQTLITPINLAWIDLEQGGNWRLFSCEERKPFVCYSVPTVKTLVKMRVKLEDSSVDLSDPAVKEQILKQLQDRLKENGLSGVTLKLKEQADGKVFHREEKGFDKKKKIEL
ncbi:unnamed protein product [Pleuronectes platessa]|uniref:C-type lectin domain-containing protein n=1 Tax=Pleuronectes platessa TaxID=8262 RepID=A0A9N7Z1X6_PLEPL|nr:unnamed protein product [Pleuronectes platessa]